MITFQLLPSELLDVETDLIVVPIFSDLIPLKSQAGYLDWRLNGEISRLIKTNKVSGVFEEVSLIFREHKTSCGTALLLGFGKLANINSPKLTAIYSYLGQTIKSIGKKRFAISLSLPSSSNMSDYESIATSLVEGLTNSLMSEKESADYKITIAEKDVQLLKSLKNILAEIIKAKKLTGKITIEDV